MTAAVNHQVDEVLAAFAVALRAAGVPVTLHVRGHSTAVDPGLELSAYRVVQEALTNVIKHPNSPSSVVVEVVREPDEVRVDVVDDGRPDGPSTP